jgi:hypothetical protein
MALDPPKRGRPRSLEPKPGGTVSAWLPPTDYDKIIKLAKDRETTVSALMRAWLQLQIKS